MGVPARSASGEDFHAFIRSDSPLIGTSRHAARRSSPASAGSLTSPDRTPPFSLFADTQLHSAPAPHAVPNRAVVRFVKDSPTNTLCSGFLYGPDIVATAAHCIYQNDRFFDDLTAIISDGQTVLTSRIKRQFTVVGYRQLSETDPLRERYDYAAVQLTAKVGNTVGCFGIGWSDASLTARPVRHAGFPTSTVVQRESHGTVRHDASGVLFYDAETRAGMSGGPVFSISTHAGGGRALAINTHRRHDDMPADETESAFHSWFHGVRISRRVFENLMAWKEMA